MTGEHHDDTTLLDALIALEAAVERAAKAERERDEAWDLYVDLQELILEQLPYYYDDGEEPPDAADPVECVKYAAAEVRRLKRKRDEALRISRFLAEQYLDEICGYLRGRQFSFMSDEEEALWHLGYTVDEWLEIDVGEPQWAAVRARWERGIQSVIDDVRRSEGGDDGG